MGTSNSITSPQFSKITINLNDQYYPGKTFTIEARNNSEKNVYIKSAILNGKAVKEPRIPFSAIAKGGSLVLEMDSNPENSCWKR